MDFNKIADEIKREITDLKAQEHVALMVGDRTKAAEIQHEIARLRNMLCGILKS